MTRCTKRTAQLAFKGNTLTLHSKYSKHYEQPHTCFLTLTAKLDGVDVVSSISITVKKDLFRGGDFHEIMDIHSDETQRFASTLFDGSGRVRSELVREGSARRGTGVWGHELDSGSLILIETVFVHNAYRGQGYGKWMLQQILSQPEAQACSFAYAWPCAVGAKTKEEHSAMTACVDALFSKGGFRRVGRTEFVAYALKDPTHPSRSLAAENDATILKAIDDSIEQLLTPDEMKNLTPEEQHARKADVLAARYPLHHAIVNGTDNTIMTIYSKLLVENPSALRVQDPSGATPLHIAAMKSKPQLIKRLLETEAKGDLSLTDRQGRTPLQCLEEQLTSEREFLRTFSLPFTGHSEASRSTQSLLRAAIRQPDATNELDKSAFGCTCGQCLHGFLSPRMRLRLQGCAEVAADIIVVPLKYAPGIRPRQPIDATVLDTIYLGEYIPPAIRSKPVYASYIKGFAHCFLAAGRLLQQNTLPTAQAVRDLLESNKYEFSYTSHYFEHGGLVDHALDALLSRCKEEMEEGDEGLVEEIERLVACANDDNFDLIRDRVGATRQVNDTQYAELEDFDEMMDTDSEDEEDEDDDNMW